MNESCPTCRPVKRVELTSEVLVHFSGLQNLDNPGVWLFPKISVCLNCGFSWFTVPETELASIGKVTSAGSSARLKKSDGDGALGGEIAC